MATADNDAYPENTPDLRQTVPVDLSPTEVVLLGNALSNHPAWGEPGDADIYTVRNLLAKLDSAWSKLAPFDPDKKPRSSDG